MDITVTVKAPELASAIKALAESIGWAVAGKNAPANLKVDTPIEAPAAKAEQLPVPEQMELVPPTAPAAPAAPAVTFDQLQAKAAELVRAGNRDRVKAVLDQFGVSKISQIPDNQRTDAMAALGAA